MCTSSYMCLCTAATEATEAAIETPIKIAFSLEMLNTKLDSKQLQLVRITFYFSVVQIFLLLCFFFVVRFFPRLLHLSLLFSVRFSRHGRKIRIIFKSENQLLSIYPSILLYYDRLFLLIHFFLDLFILQE